MLRWDLELLLRQLRNMGLEIESVDETGRIVVRVPTLEEK